MERSVGLRKLFHVDTLTTIIKEPISPPGKVKSMEVVYPGGFKNATQSTADSDCVES